MRTKLLAICLLLILATSCHKTKPAEPTTPVAPPSATKTIYTFQLRLSDNTSSLIATVEGKVGKDTIELTVPALANSQKWVPYIVFEGKTITPASGVVQDFSVPVTYEIIADDGTKHTYTVVSKYRSTLFVADYTGVLQALDATTGSAIWSYQCQGNNLSGVTAGKGKVYVNGSDGLYAVDAVNGKLSWKVSYSNTLDTFAYASSIPLLADGVLYCGALDGNLRAVNAQSGAVAWSYKSDLPFSGSPALDNGVLYAGGVDSCMYAINAASGQRQWRFKTVGQIVTSPAVSNGLIAFSARGMLYILNSDGTSKWEFVGGSWWNSYTMYKNRLYGPEGNDLFCFDPVQGTSYWSTTTFLDGLSWNSRSSLSIVNDTIYQSTLYGQIVASSIVDGKHYWAFPGTESRSGGPFYASPVVCNATVFAGTYNGVLYAVDAVKGSEKWHVGLSGNVSTVCAVDSKGNIYQSGDSGLY